MTANERIQAIIDDLESLKVSLNLSDREYMASDCKESGMSMAAIARGVTYSINEVKKHLEEE